MTAQTLPSVSIDITIGLLHAKYVPPPDTGMRIRRIAAVEKVKPRKSIALILSFGSPVTLLGGRMKKTTTPARATVGAMNQNRAGQPAGVVRNAAARNGPV